MTYAKNTLAVANNMRVSVCARVNKSEQYYVSFASCSQQCVNNLSTMFTRA